MHDHSPMHSMLFNQEGTLLTANKAALASFRVTPEGLLQLHAVLHCSSVTVLMMQQQHLPTLSFIQIGMGAP